MKHIPYSKEELIIAVASSTNIYEVLRKLGKKITGGNHTYVRSKIKSLKLDVSHFTGRGSNRGPNHKGGPTRLLPEDVFVYDKYNGVRTRHSVLKRAMLEAGFEYRCMINDCHVIDSWNGKKINLQIDHINGDPVDNRKENLRFLCPNCHTQTPTHSTRKHKAR